MSIEIFILMMFVAMLVGLATGHPLAFVLGGIAVIFGLFGVGPGSLNIFINGTLGAMNDYSLIAIPMFVLMANLMSASKIVDRLFESLRLLIGGINGGLAIAVIIVSTVFAATTGVVGASVVTMGLVSIPVLLKYGYDSKLATGVVAAGGTLGILIPPSIMLVVMGVQSSVSVGDLFKASLLPGLMLAFAYCIYVLVVCYKNPKLGPPVTKEEMESVLLRKRIKEVCIYMIPPVLIVLAVLGSIFAGIATPTEASAVGAFAALLLTVFYKKFSIEMLSNAVYDTAKTTAMVLIILVGATAFSSLFLSLNGASIIQTYVESFVGGKWGVLILALVITFILGMFIDWIGIIMIVFPIFMPILETYDFNMLWVLVLVCVMLQTSFLTPPFGYSLFYVKGIVPDGINLLTIYKGIVPFVLIIVVVLAILMIFPNLALWVPNLLNG
ncbi:TRAP transporter large permease [Oceanobacillus senegalensis]|uniref:TRAP transporter large permease n=1 Tax=Oceanobacillus senegalensis TaxID=1936063 RepID=UPI000A308867|nr:TRAP transporter large permease subunit [Oceanobacillus senegalensis]